MASIRTSTLSSICDLTLSGSAPCPAVCPSSWPCRPYFSSPQLLKEVVEIEAVAFFQLAANFSACARSTLLSISSISDSRRPCREYATRCGPDGTAPAPSFLANTEKLDRFASDVTNRGAAPPRASPSTLVNTTPVSGTLH